MEERITNIEIGSEGSHDASVDVVGGLWLNPSMVEITPRSQEAPIALVITFVFHEQQFVWHRTWLK